MKREVDSMHACYIHVPFCRDICAYCDFTRCRYHKGLADKWLIAIQKEIQEKLCDSKLHTIYIGGGTPSALSLQQLEKLLKCLLPYSDHVTEYTIEANVESFDDDKIKLCKTYGVNRVSLGVQTLQPVLLDEIHRHHSLVDVRNRIQAIHACGIDNISVDLIYGLPKQSFAMWKEDLQEIVKTLDVQHISLYALTIEEHSEFGRKHVKNIDAAIEADMYEYAISFLKGHGFIHYEISNFAKSGCVSQHNMAYWRYDDFYGIGCGASGKYAHCRYDNTKNLQTYIEHGSSPNTIMLTIEDEMFEMIMMGLRTSAGVDMYAFQERYGVHILEHYHMAIQKHKNAGLLEISDSCLTATYQGMLLLNDILLDFMIDNNSEG